jgi:folate-dependent phosphoribosylglycinamide formyltransferase PurN
VSTTRTDIVLLGSDNPTTWIVYNALVAEFGPIKALIEPNIPKPAMFRLRVHKLGLAKALSQLGFILLIRPWLRRKSEARVRDICHCFGLEIHAPLTQDIVSVPSANSEACRSLLRQLGPKVIVINGTRILTKTTLNVQPALFINTHQGITPRYRGAHGAYWALHEGDSTHCGVTVHAVDEGIDTGAIIAQAMIEPAPEDNFVTYPYLQTAAALPLLRKIVADGIAGRVRSALLSGEGRVWYHPGFFQYLAGRLRGVK